MGAWGFGVFEDDFTMDIKDEFETYIGEGVGTDQAVARLLRKFSEEINDEDDSPLFYFALASILMNRNELPESIQQEALTHIVQKTNLRKWKESSFIEYFFRKLTLKSLKKQLEKTTVHSSNGSIDEADLLHPRFLPQNKKYSVYRLLDEKTGQPYYVGRTIHPELRSVYFQQNPLRK
ncbi:hypothetical protein ACFQZE_05715 [Paenibacillus sp. GCM10027627]|uniref:hypothetical protein n=1 Tax=unclassified Paenibacillus TaxID=185978 RepID=UPI00363B23CA